MVAAEDVDLRSEDHSPLLFPTKFLGHWLLDTALISVLASLSRMNKSQLLRGRDRIFGDALFFQWRYRLDQTHPSPVLCPANSTHNAFSWSPDFSLIRYCRNRRTQDPK